MFKPSEPAMPMSLAALVMLLINNAQPELSRGMPIHRETARMVIDTAATADLQQTMAIGWVVPQRLKPAPTLHPVKTGHGQAMNIADLLPPKHKAKQGLRQPNVRVILLLVPTTSQPVRHVFNKTTRSLRTAPLTRLLLHVLSLTAPPHAQAAPLQEAIALRRGHLRRLLLVAVGVQVVAGADKNDSETNLKF